MAESPNGQDPTSYLGVVPTEHPKNIVAQRAPTSSDRRYKIGTLWIDKSANASYQLTSVVAASANWQVLGSPTAAIATLTGNSGGAITPVAGNIDLLGGTNITAVGTAGTLTFNLDDAISLATSLTTPTIIATAGNNMQINAATGFNLLFNMGDDAGANNFDIRDSGGTSQWLLDSDGAVTQQGNLILNGAATQLQMQGGAVTDFIGTATLSSGTVTIANTNIAAGDRIFIQRQDVNSSTAIGHLTYTISASTSFTITSVQAASPGSTETNDASIVMYHIIREI